MISGIKKYFLFLILFITISAVAKTTEPSKTQVLNEKDAKDLLLKFVNCSSEKCKLELLSNNLSTLERKRIIEKYTFGKLSGGGKSLEQEQIEEQSLVRCQLQIRKLSDKENCFRSNKPNELGDYRTYLFEYEENRWKLGSILKTE